METQLTADLRNICVTRVLRRIPLVKQELATLPEFTCNFQFGSCYSIFNYMCNALQIVVCPFVLFLVTNVLSVLRVTDSYYPFGIFKLFLFGVFVDYPLQGQTFWAYAFVIWYSILFTFEALLNNNFLQWKWTCDTMPLQWRLCRKDDIFISLSIRSVDDVWIHLQYLQTFLDSTTEIIFSHSIKMEITIAR